MSDRLVQRDFRKLLRVEDKAEDAIDSKYVAIAEQKILENFWGDDWTGLEGKILDEIKKQQQDG
tara:strand:- start:1016 stop:1207 length:192 start_codon:yes stop_codon:yes gene_type:complete